MEIPLPDSSGELPDEEGVHLVVDDLSLPGVVDGADGLVVAVHLVAVVVLGLGGCNSIDILGKPPT